MSRAYATPMLLAFLIGVSTSCSGNCSEKTKDKAEPAVAASPEAPIEAIRRTLQECKQGLEDTKDLVEKAKAINEELATEAKVFEEQGILAAIPTSLETEKAKKQIAIALEKEGFTAERIQIEYHEVREKTKLPRYFPGPPPYPYTNEELQEIIRIHVDLAPLEHEKSKALAKVLSESSPRLIRTEKPIHREGFSRIPLDIFRFRQIKPPTQSYQPPSKSLLLKAQGLPEEGPDCQAQEECLKILKQIDETLIALEPLRAQAELTLRLESELDMWKARRALFDENVQEIRARLMDETEPEE